MSGLIRSFQAFDASLAECIDTQVGTELILTDIQTGSVVTWLRTWVSDIDDAELMKHGWKAITRTFLVKVKHLVLRYLQDRKVDKSTFEELQKEIERQTQDMAVKKIPTYGRVRRKSLLDFYEQASRSVSVLGEKDEAKYVSREEETAISKTYEVSEELREEILTEEKSTSHHDLVLPVKKPDYLGQSKWELRYQNHSIEASIEDKEWLARFQDGAIKLLPGDSLSVRVAFEVKEAVDTGEAVVHYRILKVKDVVRGHKQGDFFANNDIDVED